MERNITAPGEMRGLAMRKAAARTKVHRSAKMRGHLGGLVLAAGAVDRSSPVEADLLQYRVAASARLPAAPVNAQFVHEIARPPIASDEVPERRAAALDRALQSRLDRIGKRRQPWPGQAARRDPRPDARDEKRLVGVDVANAHHHAGVHEERLDGDSAAPGAHGEMAAVEVVGQGLDAEVAQQPVVIDRERLPVQAAEAARIGQAHGTGIVELEVDVIVLGWRRTGRHHRQVSGHAEVDDQSAGVEMHQEILGASFDGIYALISDRIREPDRPAQRGVADNDPAQLTPAQNGFEAAPRGFDFREFGQACPRDPT